MARTFRLGDEDDERIMDARARRGEPVLRDGERMVVPLTMADGMPADVARGRHRQQAEDAAARRFGLGDALDLHRPGPRHVTDADALDERQRAYDEYLFDLENAWRNPPAGVGEREFAGGRVGDACTVKSGGGRFGPEGSRGTLQLVGGELVCVADRSSKDALTMDEVYAAYDRAVENAWRQP